MKLKGTYAYFFSACQILVHITYTKTHYAICTQSLNCRVEQTLPFYGVGRLRYREGADLPEATQEGRRRQSSGL